MGLFSVNMEQETTVEGLLRSAIENIELYLPYCSTGNREGTFNECFLMRTVTLCLVSV